MIFDTHAHLDDRAFDDDRSDLIREMINNGVGKAVNVGADRATTLNSIKLAGEYDFIYAAIGAHPEGIDDVDDDFISFLKEQAQSNPKVVAIGEIGLDYHYEDLDRESQKRAFERQLSLAIEVNKPVIIHSRDAAEDTMEILKRVGIPKAGGVMHCFSYSPEIADEVIKMGMYIGIGGVVTFKNAKKLVKTVENISLSSIITETDCPYLSPEPHRGERNNPMNIAYVIDKIAEIKGISAREVEEAVWRNAHDMYRINL